jgi:hypothetical protein
MLAVLTLLFGGVGRSDAGPIVPALDENQLTMMEAPLTGITSLAIVAGPDFGNKLPWTASYSNTGWNWNLSATYLGSPLNLSYVGTFHPAGTLDPKSDVVSWLGTGSFGNLTISDSGSATYIDDVSWKQLLAIGLTGLVITGVEVLGTVASEGTAVGPIVETSVKGFVVTTGIILVGSDAIELGKKIMGSNHADATSKHTPDGTLVAMVGSGTESSFTGTIDMSPAPEPSAASLFGLGGSILGLLGYRWRWRNPKPA